MSRAVPTVRLAENSEGELVKAILLENGPVEESLRFDRISPYWLVAELPGRGIVGCVQTLPSRPAGHLEMLSVSKSLTEAERGLVARELTLTGSALLAHNGADCAMGLVTFANRGYKRALKRRGAISVAQGNMMLRRIR